MYLIKETKNDTFFCGCFHYNEDLDCYYMSFGSDYDAKYYYDLKTALDVIDFILENEIFWLADELLIYSLDTNECFTIAQAEKLIKNC